MNLRISIVRKVIWALEQIFFYPKLKRELLKNSRISVTIPPILIFDVGTNRGQSIDFFRTTFSNPIIHCFEPLPQLFSELIKYKSDSKIYLNNLCIVSPEFLKLNGTKIVFYESILDETSTLVLPDPDSSYQYLKSKLLGQSVDKLYKEIEVDATTLDLYCISRRISKIDILKIDVEGYELGVLEGCTTLLESNRVLCVVLESHENDMRRSSKGTIDKILISSNFQLISRIRHPFGKFFEEIWIRD